METSNNAGSRSRDLSSTLPRPTRLAIPSMRTRLTPSTKPLLRTSATTSRRKLKRRRAEALKNGGTEFPSDGENAPDDLQAEFSSYANDYEFGTRAAGGGGEGALPRDPVDREAYIMARDMIKQHAKSKGYKLDAEQIAGLIPGILAKRPEIREEASRRISAKTSISLKSWNCRHSSQKRKRKRLSKRPLTCLRKMRALPLLAVAGARARSALIL